MMLKNLFDKIFEVVETPERKTFRFLFLKFSLKTISDNRPCVVVVDAGGIGDYMFNRPYFKYLTQCEKFKGCKFIYVGMAHYADMTTSYDNEYFSEVIPYDTKLYHKSYFYRQNILKNINRNNVIAVINLRCFVHGNNDFKNRAHIVKNIKCKDKYIGIVSVNKNLSEKHTKRYEKVYNHIFYSKDLVFESEGRRRFFEYILETPIPHEFDKITPIYDYTKKHIAISISASMKERIYPYEKWVEIINAITDKIDSNTEILFLGTAKEKETINNIISKLKHPQYCNNVAGKLPISIIPTLLASCEFLISVETGTVHIAQSVNCKTVCICQGEYWGRYQPYKNENIIYVYPKEFRDFIKNATEDELIAFYKYNTTFNIADIEQQDIIDAAAMFMNRV